MMLKGHNTITVTGRVTRMRVEQWPGLGASFGLNTCPVTPIDLTMHLEGFGISRFQSQQQQMPNYSLSMH